MLPILMVLGLGLTMSLLMPDDGDASGAKESEEPDVYSDGDDAIISEDFRDGVEAYGLDLVGEGEITIDEYDEAIAATHFVTGPMNIDAGGGEDLILGSDGDDTLDAGAGDDIVDGGAGDDEIVLGDGSDVSGVDWRVMNYPDDYVSFPNDFAPFGTEAEYEGGNDTISGGSGDDFVADGYGENVLKGRNGADLLVAVDQDGVTPDEVYAGRGSDEIYVDEGDLVTTSTGQDVVHVEIHGAVEAGYDVVTITDFDPANDTLEIYERVEDYVTDPITNPVTVADLEDGSGAMVSIGGVPVVMVVGGQGMTVDNILL